MTKFEHIGAHAALPGDWELLFQWMTGSTVMGPVMNGAHVVDTEFDSKYLPGPYSECRKLVF